jgi:hypothetical protein
LIAVSSFNAEMIDAVKTSGIQPKRTSYRSPWQNGVAARWVGTCRRDLLDLVIVLNVRHLKQRALNSGPGSILPPDGILARDTSQEAVVVQTLGCGAK